MRVFAFPVTLPLDELVALEQTLSPAERARGDRIIRPDARRRFVVTRARLRERLGEVLGIAPHEVRLADRPGAAPTLEDGHVPISFSASHSGDMALIAVSAERRVGVDIEQIRPRRHIERLGGYAEWTATEARFKCGDPDADVEHIDAAPGYAAAVAYARDS